MSVVLIIDNEDYIKFAVMINVIDQNKRGRHGSILVLYLIGSVGRVKEV